MAGIVRQLVQDLSDQPTMHHELVGGNAENPGGFFESEMLVETNDTLLEFLNASWDRPFLAKPVWKNPKLLEILVPLREKFKCYWQEPWIDKDPRLCLLWDAYTHIFLRKPTGVAVVRNPLLVASSLELRNGFSPTKSAMLWWLYHYHLLNVTEPSRLLVICDAALVQGEPNCMSGLSTFISKWMFADGTISNADLQKKLEMILRESYQPSYRRAHPLEPQSGSLLEQAFHLWLKWQESGHYDDILREGFAHMPSQLLDLYEQEMGQGLHDSYPPMSKAFAQRCEITQTQSIKLSGLKDQLERCEAKSLALQQEADRDKKRLEIRCELLQKDFEAIKSSSSWRLTRPLRWLIQRLQSLKKTKNIQP